MTSNGRVPMSRAERDFDAFLDGLVVGAGEGRRATSGGIDQGLVGTARHLHALAEVPDVSTPPASALASIREDIMGYEPIAAVADIAGSAQHAMLHANGRAPSQADWRRGERVAGPSRWPVTALSFAAMLLLLLGLGAIAYRIGPGAPSPGQGPSPMPAAIIASSPTTSLPTDFIEPRPAACAVAPRTGEDVQTDSAASGAFAQLDIASPTSSNGPLADPATVDAIIATLRELYVCLEIGDEARASALLSDEALVQGPSLQTFGPREAFRVVAAIVLPDRRVLATIDFRVSEGIFRETWIFVGQGDRYLVGAVLPPEPDVPDPSECRVEPRTINEVAELFNLGITGRVVGPGTPADATIAPSGPPGTPIIFTNTPIAVSPPLTELPNGPAPDSPTVAAVTATWREYIACGNAGDYLRLTALFSDAGFQRTWVFGDLRPSDDDLAIMRSGGFFPVDETTAFMPLTGMRVLPDGRVGAIFEFPEPIYSESDGGNLVVFVQIDGRWLIDQLGAPSGASSASGDHELAVSVGQTPDAALGAGVKAQPTEDVRLRPEPGFDNEEITILKPSDTVTIIGGPIEADGVVWWLVQLPRGVTGWVVQDFIEATN